MIWYFLPRLPRQKKKKGGGGGGVIRRSKSTPSNPQTFWAPWAPLLDAPFVAHCAAAAGFPRLSDAKCLGRILRAREFSGGVGGRVLAVIMP